MKHNVQKPFCKPFKVNDIITVKLECTMSYYELRYTVNGKDIGNYNAINDDKDEGDKKRKNKKNQTQKQQNNDNNNDNDNKEKEEDDEKRIMIDDNDKNNKNKNEKNKNKDNDIHINKNDRVAYRLPNDKTYEMVIALKNSIYKIKCISFQTKPFTYY